MARNAELVFWSNMPAAGLVLAIVPHAAFVAAQAAWRLLRRRLGPFVAGKREALRAWPQIRARRRVRAALAQTSVRSPHFALSSGSLEDVRNHWKRPLERSRA
jgi:hypothetical protein